MVERLYIKNLIHFDEVDIEFREGLTVFTGSSGAGKSLLLQAMLANFGYGNSEAHLCETELKKPDSLYSEAYDIDESVVIRAIKKERTRYYINNQNISHRKLKMLFGGVVHHLSVRDKSGFENSNLIKMIDSSGIKDKEYNSLLNEYTNRYKIYKSKKAEFKKLQNSREKLAELMEFTRFEIDKISKIDPKEGEYEKLLDIKQKLSRVDKLNSAISKVSNLFEIEDTVLEFYTLADMDSSYFSEAINRLRSDIDSMQLLAEELNEIDIEGVLDRLESLDTLVRRYGSISKALDYKREKEKELNSYLHIEESESELIHFLESEKSTLEELAKRLSRYRKKESKIIEKELNNILKSLKLPEALFVFENIPLYECGVDNINIKINNSKISTLSGGEFNRLRLALMSVVAKRTKENGVIFLDEIDANVSGDESIAIANMIAQLAKSYQIFAISHQPHLSAVANNHILVTKKSNKSTIKILNGQDRVLEIARIIGGDNPNSEAVAFAKKLL